MTRTGNGEKYPKPHHFSALVTPAQEDAAGLAAVGGSRCSRIAPELLADGHL